MEHIVRIHKHNMEPYREYIPDFFLQGFEEAEAYSFYGMTVGGRFAGVLVLEIVGVEAYVQYMYVEPKFQFFQSRMIEFVAYELCAFGIWRLVWKFLEDDTVCKNVQMFGFQVKKDDIARFEFQIQEIKQVALFSEQAKNVIALEALDSLLLKQLGNELAISGDDMITLPINKQGYIADCSAVYMEQNQPKGILLLTRDEDGKLFIPYMFSESTHPAAILNMMRFTFENASRKFDESETCSMYIVEPVLVKIVEKVLEIKGQYQCTAIRELAYIADYQKAYEKLESDDYWDWDLY